MIFSNINTLWAHVLVDEFVRCGVRRVVISPGSRSTPLTLAFANHPDVVDHSVIDERSAGFFALGLAMETQSPVVLLCTSGTAAANYLAAICEASHSRMPLIVLTADRPAWLRDSGSPQSMSQHGLYREFVVWQHEVAQPDADRLKLRYLRTTADKAFRMAKRGPVHLNIPFSKPLEPTEVDRQSSNGVADLDASTQEVAGAPNGAPWVHFNDDATRTWAFVRQSRRPVLVAGAMIDGSRYRDEILLWLTAGIPVIAEAASQLREVPGVLFADAWLNEPANRKSFTPDLIVHLGRAPINWPIQTWFSRTTCQVVFVGPEDPQDAANPDHRRGMHLVGGVERLPEIRCAMCVDPGWLTSVAQACVGPEMTTVEQWCDAAVHSVLSQSLPDDAIVFVSSSMPLRDLETQWTTAHSARILFNRGLNGIDGVMSTAFGVASASQSPVFVIIGDVAFAHDLGALLTAKREKVDATIILIDNGGGAIFDHLPVQKFDRKTFERHFHTSPEHNIARLADAYGISYVLIQDRQTFVEALSADQQGLRIIHARTSGHAVDARTSGHAVDARTSGHAVDARTSGHAVDARTSGHAVARPKAGISPVVESPAEHLTQAAEPTVVLLHGFTDIPQAWDILGPQIAQLTGLPVLAQALPGHDGQVASSDWETTLDDFRTLWPNGLLHLIGYSMGGRLALSYASRFPEQVATLTCIGAHAGLPIPELTDRRLADEQLAQLAEADLETFLRKWAQNPILNLGPPDADSRQQKNIRRRKNRGAGLADALRKLGPAAMPQVRPEDLRMPALFVAGELDKKYTTIAYDLAARAPHARAAIVAGAGHAIHEDQPDEFIQLIRQHVR